MDEQKTLIKVNGSDLNQHLEDFMWEILNGISKRAQSTGKTPHRFVNRAANLMIKTDRTKTVDGGVIIHKYNPSGGKPHFVCRAKHIWG